MAKLTFFGRSNDGGHLLLKDESGKTYTLAIDARLRLALRGEPDRNGQLEIQMESALRPRDIQALIRAGEPPEVVAQAAGTSVDKIMPFAAPVLAERAHVAERAQLSSVRRRSGDHGARTLGEAVAAQLRQHNVDPDSVEWDAWRREDGRWTLTGAFSSGPRSGTATYSFDMRGNFVTIDDDDARWLVGDIADAPAAPDVTTPAVVEETPLDDLAAARQRRLSAVSADELPLGADAIEMVTGSASQPAAEAPATDDHEVSPNETTLEITADHFSAPADATPTDGTPSGEDQVEDDQATAQQRQEPSGRKSRRRGRASVPSWDEIMFGGGKGD
ncbi:MAG: DUF3071 domain-containing protein [Nocardioides sp.]|nr:DUF3071 domain-containing protein [Nocardioides sp.]